MASEQSEVFSVGRPVECEDLFGTEFGDLVTGGTVEWLNPDVVHAVLANGIGDSIAIGGELRARGDLRIDIDETRVFEGR